MEEQCVTLERACAEFLRDLRANPHCCLHPLVIVEEQIQAHTRRAASVMTQQLIDQIDPVIRGWASTIARPKCASSSTSLTAGSCTAFGRIAIGAGLTVAGNSYLSARCETNTGLSD